MDTVEKYLSEEKGFILKSIEWAMSKVTNKIILLGIVDDIFKGIRESHYKGGKNLNDISNDVKEKIRSNKLKNGTEVFAFISNTMRREK